MSGPCRALPLGRAFAERKANSRPAPFTRVRPGRWALRSPCGTGSRRCSGGGHACVAALARPVRLRTRSTAGHGIEARAVVAEVRPGLHVVVRVAPPVAGPAGQPPGGRGAVRAVPVLAPEMDERPPAAARAGLDRHERRRPGGAGLHLRATRLVRVEARERDAGSIGGPASTVWPAGWCRSACSSAVCSAPASSRGCCSPGRVACPSRSPG